MTAAAKPRAPRIRPATTADRLEWARLRRALWPEGKGARVALEMREQLSDPKIAAHRAVGFARRFASCDSPAAKAARTHTVQIGDTLEKIARQYYGASDRWRSVYEANSSQLSNGQPLRAGMTLQIPEN